MYGHPYEPYDVQQEFMKALYWTLSNKKVGIFESPTGTGKTLSLLCPSLAWLRNAADRELQVALAAIDAGGGPEWARKAAKDMKIAEFHSKKRKTPDDCVQRARDPYSTSGGDPDSYTDTNTDTNTDANTDASNKIYFVSRTHSQLTQVAEALKRIKVVPPPRFVTLGSRKQLCIHPEVRKLGSVEQMNDKCVEIQKSSGGCEFKHNTQPLRDQIAQEILDIEDLYRDGKQECACPYYATREALPQAEIVAVPYPILLVGKNRESLGIDLQNCVVIIDEAHNLVDTLTSLHSATLTLEVVERALHGLKAYLRALDTRLGPDNRRRVQQIIKLAECLQHYFIQHSSSQNVRSGSPVNISELLSFGNADTLDIMGLNEFAQESKLIFKVESYSRREQKSMQYEHQNRTDNNELTSKKHSIPQFKKVTDANLSKSKGGSELSDPHKPATQDPPQGPSNSLGILFSFVLLATNPIYEGRLYHDFDQNEFTGKRYLVLRFLSLDPAPLFEDIVSDANCVVLAGGTMEPMSDFTTYLLPQNTEVGQYSYGHIVPKSQLLVVPLSDQKFTFASRSDPAVIADLGKTLLSIVKSTPNGVVAFFPGYGYLAQVIAQWKKTGVWNQLEQYKKVFYESKVGQNSVFEDYSRSVSGKGALLLAVVGGRLSEGINFSDDLARAVVMIGLPFPNAMSAEMVAKRQFIEQSSRDRGESLEQAKENARQYYENMAMRAVNQSVGRAIRHKNDFAAIYLIDARYKLTEVQSKLSKWVRDSIDVNADSDKIRKFWDTNKSESL